MMSEQLPDNTNKSHLEESSEVNEPPQAEPPTTSSSLEPPERKVDEIVEQINPPPPETIPTAEEIVNYEEVSGKVKKRKKKDPKAPRRPLSAYNIFFKAVREEVHSSSTDRPSFSGLVQLVSTRWRTTPPNEKSKYELEAKEDYQRYADEMKIYRQRPEVQNLLVDPNAGGNKRRCKFLGVSKRPLSGYNIFFREEHARLKKLKAEGAGDEAELACMTVAIAKKWSELTEADKSDLNKRAAESQRAAEEAEAQKELQRKAASLKNQMLPQSYGPPPGSHPALLAHYHDYYAARLQQMNQNPQQRDAMPFNAQGGPNVSMMQGPGTATAMPATEPPKEGEPAQANWDAILKQQQEQHFHQQYVQWCFEQVGIIICYYYFHFIENH